MYKHPMLSVKEAAVMLGCDERWIRERLNQGHLKGEKKNIGAKEKWFVYKSEIDAALARKGVFPTAMPEPPNFALGQATNALQPPAVNQTYFAPPVEPVSHPIQPYVQQARSQEPAVAVGTTISMQSLAERQSPAVIEGVNESGDIVEAEYSSEPKALADRERERIKAIAEVMVIPLLEKLEKQTSALDAKDRLIEEQKQQLRLLPDLEAKKRELENKVDGERKAAQVQYERAIELEKQLEDERKAQEAEVERIKAEKETETKAIQEQLSKLTYKLEKLEQPWWKRWLTSGE